MTEEFQPFSSHDNIYAFASMMVRDTYVFHNAENVLEFLDKPWNWNKEFALWDSYGRPTTGDESFDDFADALTDMQSV